MQRFDRIFAGTLLVVLLPSFGCLTGERRHTKIAPSVPQPPPATGLRIGESIRVTDDVFPGAHRIDEDTTVWVWRIVDHDTGEPIPDAVVQAPNHVSGAPEDLYFLAEAEADEDGWVRLRQDQIEGYRDYILADAPGYAPNEHCLPGADVVELRPGTDVPIVLYDFLGRPVPNAIVGYNLGCGHVPDQRTARTDAYGRAVLPSIWPERHNDLFVVSEGLHASCSHLSRTWRPGEPPVAIHSSPGLVLEGRILMKDGTPAVGAFIDSTFHRPAAVADEFGRFRLVGIAKWEDMFASIPPFDEEPPRGVEIEEFYADQLIDFTMPPAGVPIELVQGEPRSGVPLEVRCVGSSGEPANGVLVAACRPRDGCTVTERTNDRGIAELSVPTGTYRILVDGKLGAWGDTEVPFEIEGNDAHELTIEVPRNPTVRVDSSRLPEHVNVRIATPTRFLLIEFDEPITHVPVPTSEPAVFRISGNTDPGSYEDSVRYFEIPLVSTSTAADRAPIVLEWLPTTRLHANFEGPDGNPALAYLDLHEANVWNETDTDSTSVIRETCLDGEVHWTATPVDASLDPVSGSVDIPAGGGDVDLGTIRFLPAPLRELTILLPPDTSPDSVHVGDSRYEWPATVIAADSDRLVVTDTWFDPGTIVELTTDPDSWLPFRFELEGTAPWEVEWPTATIDLVVRDPNGAPLADASILLDREELDLWPKDDGTYRLAGIAAGPRQLIVAADFHKSVVFELIVEDGEYRQLELTLERRPKRQSLDNR